MDEAKFRRIRQIIIDSHAFVDGGISFDTSRPRENGYSDEEIADAEHLLTESSFYTKNFLTESELILGDHEDKPRIFFVEFAKIIFVLFKDSEKSILFFEEDLQKEVLMKQYMGFCDDFLKNKPAA